MLCMMLHALRVGMKAACVVGLQVGAAKAAWAQIQQRMKPPLCKGHAEPSVIRQVKKGGPNQGKGSALHDVVQFHRRRWRLSWCLHDRHLLGYGT